MKIEKVQNTNISFGIKTSYEMIKKADRYYREILPDRSLFSRFYRKAKYMEANYGYPEYTIFTKTCRENKRSKVSLMLIKDGECPNRAITIASRPTVREIFEKFVHLTEEKLDMLVASAKKL